MAEKDKFQEDDVRAALARILGSAGFAKSDRMIRFLQYLVEQTLQGRSKELKGYTIGVDVFDRDGSFDPGTDAVVRVEAGRLRKKLKHYYLTDGKDDAVVIDVPTGTYAPQFSHHRPAPPRDDPKTGNWRLAWQMLNNVPKSTIGLVTGLAFISFVVFEVAERYFFDGLDRQALTEAAKIPQGPSIAVLPFRDLSAAKDSQFIAEGLSVHVTTDLTQFKSLFVFAPDTMFGDALRGGSPQDIGRKLSARYVLSGTVRRSSDWLQVDVRLTVTKTAQVIWAEKFKQKWTPVNAINIESQISHKVSAQVGQPEGLINRHIAGGSHTKAPRAMSSYECVQRFYWYLRHKSDATHAAARRCLDSTLKQEPDYAEAWAALSWIIADEKRLGYNGDPQAGDPFVRSLHAAERAVEYDPLDAVAHLYLGKAQFALSDDELAGNSLVRALTLNPNDANLLANAGTTLALMGNWQQGIALMHKAIVLNPGHPRWYFGILFADAYRRHDYAQALKQAKAYYRPEILLSHAFLVAAHAMLEQKADAQEASRQMRHLFPDYRQAVKEQLRLWRLPEEIADSILDGLRKAGMSPGA